MKLLPYPKYKPSGVEWIGEVPDGWEVERFSRVVRIAEGQVDPETEPYASMILVAPNHIESGTGRLLAMETAAEQGAISGKYLCRRADVIYSKIRPALGKATIAPEDCLCSADMYPMTPTGRLHGGFLLAVLLSSPFTAWSVLEADRVAMPKINRETLNDLQLPVPRLTEQEAIAEFLDCETTRIHTLVTKKRTLIERLKEKRTALISLTVTRGLPPAAARAAGLDPHPKLKPSGIDSIGDIPAHWDLKRFMDLTDQARPIMYGIVLPGPDVDEGVPIVKGGDVKPGRLTLGNLCRTTAEIEAAYVRSRLREGDIVFSIRGTVGEAELVPKEIAGANLTQDAARISSSVRVNNRWFLYSMKARSIVDPLLSLSLGAAVRGVNIRDLKRTVAFLPPLNEQRAIADFLDREAAKIDQMIDKVETALERLQEYRTALITAAVTGKIDVRARTAHNLTKPEKAAHG